VKWGKGERRIRNSDEYWKKPYAWDRRAKKNGIRIKVFAASMADVFDDEVDPSWRSDFWNVVRDTPNLDWQVLTKRPQNILEFHVRGSARLRARENQTGSFADSQFSSAISKNEM
jgi:protein gp37